MISFSSERTYLEMNAKDPSSKPTNYSNLVKIINWFKFYP